MLILDRDVDYREELAAELKAAGAQVEIASKAEEGLAQAIALQPELVMVGLGIEPRKEDLDLLPRVWEAAAAPVLVLQEGPTSPRRLEEAARAGAVACLSKGEVLPRAAAGFATSQLIALGRTPSRFRRSGVAVLDVVGRSLRVGEEMVALTRMQAEILAVLLEPPADEWKPIPAITRRVFGDGASQSVVRKHVNRLRVKFARTGLRATIETAHARGYRLMASDGARNQDRKGQGAIRDPLR
ncbi:MAG: response regulator transcription factor [Anaerolineales bacterium]